jgi:phosphate transport system substrate-binding protein
MNKYKLLTASALALFMLSCGDAGTPGKSDSDSVAPSLKGEINIDGSSTVYPISEAVAEDFSADNADVHISVAESGTGGGFKKFGRGETDINDASRPIKSTEDSLCKASNIAYESFLVAYDGISIVVNPQNDWCKDITVAELKKIWEPEAQGKINKWSQVRAGWPNEEIHLYGPGSQSGTFDFFTEAINGKSKACRGDYTASEDDNVLVQGIAGDKYALGYFGLAYYEANQDKLTLVGVDNGNGAVKPSVETVKNKTYAPLSRPLFIYVSATSAAKPEVAGFVNFYLDHAVTLSAEVGYVPLTAEESAAEKAKFATFTAKK